MDRFPLSDRLSGAVGYQQLAIAAFVALALVYVRPIEIGAAVAGTTLLIGTRILRETGGRVASWGFGAAALLLVTGLLMWWSNPAVGLTTALVLPLAAVAMYLSWRSDAGLRTVRIAVAALLLAIVGLVGVMWITVPEPPDIDVLNLHVSAADALLDGRNPYVHARAPNTSPVAPEGAEFVGYTYPPTVLLAYAGSEILLGDARWATVIMIAVCILLIVRPWATMARAQGAAVAALALALVVQPALGWFFLQGWTDAMALPLLLACGLLWRKHPAAAAVLLGVAFGTKQYFVLALPLLLLWRDDYRIRRCWIATGAAVLTVLPALVVDAAAYWNATVAPTLANPPARLDSAGLAGLGVELPLAAVVALGVVLAVWLGRRGGDQTRFLIGLAAVLALAFLVGFQAFINYWFFVGSLALLAVAPALTGADASFAAEVPSVVTTRRSR